MKIGLIAGGGKLPVIFAQRIAHRGDELISINLKGASEELKKYASIEYTLAMGNVQEIIDVLLKEKITELAVMGKVPKESIFTEDVDQRGASILKGLNNWDDQTIMQGIAAELEKEGIEIIPQTKYLGDLLAEEGILTGKVPDERLWADINYGLKKAEELARLNIGQTVVVKDQTVLAVEAIEGTDAAIRRGGSFAKRAVVAKTSRLAYDPGFDIATVGIDTLTVMHEVEAECLAVRAGHVFILDKGRVLEEADAFGITVVGAVGSSK